jgi:four helix bundle protein
VNGSRAGAETQPKLSSFACTACNSVSGPEHEKLIAYRRSLEAVVQLDELARAIARHRPDLTDQLRRAAASIPLNLAEGAGEFSPAEKARFYRMARRSAAECMAATDVAQLLVPGISDTSVSQAKLRELIAMLTALVSAVEARKLRRVLRTS